MAGMREIPFAGIFPLFCCFHLLNPVYCIDYQLFNVISSTKIFFPLFFLSGTFGFLLGLFGYLFGFFGFLFLSSVEGLTANLPVGRQGCKGAKNYKMPDARSIEISGILIDGFWYKLLFINYLYHYLDARPMPDYIPMGTLNVYPNFIHLYPITRFGMNCQG